MEEFSKSKSIHLNTKLTGKKKGSHRKRKNRVTSIKPKKIRVTTCRSKRTAENKKENLKNE